MALDTKPTVSRALAQRARLAHPRVRRAFLAGTAGIAALVVLVAGVGMVGYFYTRSHIRTIPTPAPEVASPGATGTPRPDISGICPNGRDCNYLLLGSDSRTGLSRAEQTQFGTNQDIGGSNRSDTIILVHINAKDGKAIFLSFPRDLWVNIPGAGYNKINSAFAGGINGFGAQRVARTVTSISGLPVDHVLYVDLAGFQGLVDALGGLDMYVPYPMQDPLTGLNVQAGLQHFNGYKALAYVRTRHQVCDTIPDFARIARQQQFLRAIIAKLLRPTELLHLPSLVPALLANLVVDRGLRNPAELDYLAGQLKGVTTGNADFRVIPTVPASIYPNGVYTSIVRMVQPQAGQLFDRIREDKPLGDLGLTQAQTPPSPAVIATGVYDRHSTGVAAGIFNLLTESGFNTSLGLRPAGSLSTLPVKGSAILYNPTAPDGQAMADVVHSYLANLRELPAPKHLLHQVDVAVVIGDKYVLPPPSTTPPPSCPGQ